MQRLMPTHTHVLSRVRALLCHICTRVHTPVKRRAGGHEVHALLDEWCIYLYTYSYIFMYMYINICMYIHQPNEGKAGKSSIFYWMFGVCIHIHTRIHMYICTYVHICTYGSKYIYAHTSRSKGRRAGGTCSIGCMEHQARRDALTNPAVCCHYDSLYGTLFLR